MVTSQSLPCQKSAVSFAVNGYTMSTPDRWKMDIGSSQEIWYNCYPSSCYYVILTSVYVPRTSRNASHISPTVAYARTASIMKGMVFAEEVLPLETAEGDCAAAFFKLSRQRWTSSLERRARRASSFALCSRATASSMYRICGGSSFTVNSFTP